MTCIGTALFLPSGCLWETSGWKYLFCPYSQDCQFHPLDFVVVCNPWRSFSRQFSSSLIPYWTSSLIPTSSKLDKIFFLAWLISWKMCWIHIDRIAALLFDPDCQAILYVIAWWQLFWFRIQLSAEFLLSADWIFLFRPSFKSILRSRPSSWPACIAFGSAPLLRKRHTQVLSSAFASPCTWGTSLGSHYLWGDACHFWKRGRSARPHSGGGAGVQAHSDGPFWQDRKPQAGFLLVRALHEAEGTAAASPPSMGHPEGQPLPTEGKGWAGCHPLPGLWGVAPPPGTGTRRLWPRPPRQGGGWARGVRCRGNARGRRRGTSPPLPGPSPGRTTSPSSPRAAWGDHGAGRAGVRGRGRSRARSSRPARAHAAPPRPWDPASSEWSAGRPRGSRPACRPPTGPAGTGGRCPPGAPGLGGAEAEAWGLDKAYKGRCGAGGARTWNAGGCKGGLVFFGGGPLPSLLCLNAVSLATRSPPPWRPGGSRGKAGHARHATTTAWQRSASPRRCRGPRRGGAFPRPRAPLGRRRDTGQDELGSEGTSTGRRRTQPMPVVGLDEERRRVLSVLAFRPACRVGVGWVRRPWGCWRSRVCSSIG